MAATPVVPFRFRNNEHGAVYIYGKYVASFPLNRYELNSHAKLGQDAMDLKLLQFLIR